MNQTLDDENLGQFSDFALKLADIAGAAILPYFRENVDLNSKETASFDPVTAADLAGECAMREAIKARFPDHGIFGEEFGKTNPQAPFQWVLDPIDGTRGFICGLPIWGILIGLLYYGKPVLGVMCQPYIGEKYYNSNGRVYLEIGGLRKTLSSSKCQSLDEAILLCTTPDLFQTDMAQASFMRLARATRMQRYGTDCYGYCVLAAGYADLVFEAGLKPYDIAPLIPIIENAGGVVTNWQGKSAVNGGDILASANEKLHELALSMINQTEADGRR